MAFGDFTDQLDQLQNIIGDGLVCFAVWQGLMAGNDDSAKALNRYRGLFLPARAALLRATVMQFFKVFDDNPKAVSLRNLLKAAKADPSSLVPHGSSREVQDIEAEVRKNKKVLKKLNAFRDQRIAHHDAAITKGMRILYGEMKRLAEDIVSWYNSLRLMHGKPTTSFEFMTRDAENHTTAVVRIMQEERDRSLQMIRALRTHN